jgi:tetratricopeptide (TPR) repeat protein
MAFGLNLATLSPAVHPDDSPETVTAGATLSIQHPPGYPLHSMLGRLAALGLPGGAAFRVNLLAAFLGALGLVLFAHCLRLIASELLGRGLPLAWAFAPTAALAVTYSLWFQSGIAKGGIYTLNFALSQATLLALLLARRSPAPPRYWRLAALAFGLGMANHWTSQVVLLPGYALLLAESWWREGRPKPGFPALKEGAWAALFTACGLSLYLYLPLRSRLDPVMSWGEPWTWKGFLWVFNRAQYAGIESGKSLAAFLGLVKRVALDTRLEFHWLGLLGLAAGWALLLRKRTWLGLALLSLPLTLALAVCVKANPPVDSLWVIDPYLLPLYSGLALGFAGLLCLDLRMVSAVSALGALALGIWHLPLADQSQNFLGYDYASNLLLSAPKDSLLFCEGDSNTALPIYYRHVLGKRRDVALVASVLSDYPWQMRAVALQNPGLKVPPQPLGPPGNLAWMAQANPARPVLLTNSFTKGWVDPSRVLPRGLLSRYVPAGAVTAKSLLANRVWPAYALRGAFTPALPMDPLTVRLVRDNYKETPARLAEALQKAGDLRGAAAEFEALGKLVHGWAAPWVMAGNCLYFAKDIEGSGRDWRRALQEEPANAEALANLALYFFSKRDFDQAQRYAGKALEASPGLASAQDILDKSRAALNQASPQAPGAAQAAAFAAQGDAHAQKGEALEALKAYDQAMALGFSNAGVYRNRAVMQAKLGKKAEAVLELRKAVAMEPKNFELHMYLGVMLFNAGEGKAALAELEESARLNPADGQVRSLLSQVKSKLGP